MRECEKRSEGVQVQANISVFSLLASLVAVAGEQDPGAPMSFRDVLLAGLGDDAGASGLSYSHDADASGLSSSPVTSKWGKSNAPASTRPQPTAPSAWPKPPSSLSDGSGFDLWQDAKEGGAKAKLRDTNRKSLEKERRREKREGSVRR